MEKTAGNSSSGDGRPSKKHRKRRPKKPKTRPESVLAVVSNDDLLTEILLRLPTLSLVLFKSVSKRWLSLIKSPTFITRLTRKLNPPCGLFLKNHLLHSRLRYNYDFVPFDIRIPSATGFIFDHEAPPGSVEILQSCNGLLLCCTLTLRFLYVYNPSVNNMFKIIPEQRDVKFDEDFGIGGIKMMFDPTKSPHYKVIHAELMVGDYLEFCVKIHTYSSETCVWSVCEDLFPYKSFICFQGGVYWNDAIHWVHGINGANFHFKLDFLNEHPVITTLKTPLNLDGTGFHECKMFESSGCLLFVGKDDFDSRKLYIYEMRNRCSEWLLKYIANLDDLTVPLPEMWSISLNVCCIVLGEREEDSFMVMKLSGKVVQYKLVSNALCTLSDLGSDNHLNCFFEFIASFANV